MVSLVRTRLQSRKAAMGLDPRAAWEIRLGSFYQLHSRGSWRWLFPCRSQEMRWAAVRGRFRKAAGWKDSWTAFDSGGLSHGSACLTYCMCFPS